jgi:hypothetical protein
MLSLKALSFYWRCNLHVSSTHCWAFHLRSFPLNSGNLSPLRGLVHSRGSPTSYLLRLTVSIHSAGPQGFIPVSPTKPDHVPLFPSLSPFPPRSLPHSVTHDYFLLPSKRTEASSLGPFILLTFLSSTDCILVILYYFVNYSLISG